MHKPHLGAFRNVAFAMAVFITSSACGPSAPEVPIVTDDGTPLTVTEMVDRLAEGGWIAEPSYDEDENVREIVVREARPSLAFEPPPGAFKIDGSVPIRDEDGNEMTPEEFDTRFSQGGVVPQPIRNENGELVEIRVLEVGGMAPSFDFSAILEGKSRSGSEGSLEWQPLPLLDLRAINGATIGPDKLRGKAVVLNFWFKGCKPCLMEIPELNAVVDAFSEEDVVFIAPTFDSEADVRTLLAEKPFKYEVVADTQDLHAELGISSYPTHLVYDRDHVCRFAFSGYSPGTGELLKMAVQKVLNP